jgi:uncharacterized protein
MSGVSVTVDGRQVADGTELIDDEADAPTTLELASLRLILLRRGNGRLALRVKDTAAPALRTFEGLRYFQVHPAWRVIGRLIRADPEATIRVPDIVGDVNAERTPGAVEFELDGRPFRPTATRRTAADASW